MAEAPEPAAYLYKPPTVGTDGLPVAKLKKEALAEAFVSRLSTKAPAGVVVMQQENLVLEEYFGLDSTAFVSLGHAFPAYTAALLGSVYLRQTGIPYKPVPLEEFYASMGESRGVMLASSLNTKTETAQSFLHRLNEKIQEQAGTSMGLAAEELLLEPMQIDDYKWQEHSLLMHPHGVLQLGSLLLRRGRWGDYQVMPDALVQRIMAPAYANNLELVKGAWGWQYHKVMARGRKYSLIYWQYNGAHVILLPDVEAVVLLQGNESLMPEAWDWLQQYLIPALTP